VVIAQRLLEIVVLLRQSGICAQCIAEVDILRPHRTIQNRNVNKKSHKHGTSGFHQLKAPTNDELIQLTHTIAHRVGRYLERQGLLVRDTGNSYLSADAVDADNETPMNHLLGS